MFISKVRRLQHWMSGQSKLSSEWRRCCLVVCCCWKAKMAVNVTSIPKILPHVIYPLRVQFIINRHACGSSMFCVWGEEMSGYNALVWSVSTRLAHGMHEATVDFFIILTVELSSLSRIFGIWCFHQLYSMILCGFHCVVPAQMKNEELWYKAAIKCEMVEFILWNMRPIAMAIKDGVHIASNLQFIGTTFTTLVGYGTFFHI